MERKEVANRLELLVLFLRGELSRETEWRAEVEKADSNCFRLKLTLPPGDNGFSRIELRVLQIGDGVKLFGRLSDHSRVSIAINLDSFIKKITKNSYVLAEGDETAAILAYFLPGQADRLRNLLRSRLIYKISGEPESQQIVSLLDLPEGIVANVITFLRPQDVLSFLSISWRQTSRFLNDNEFWFRVYHLNFKRTGFSLNQIRWREAYFNKRRELRR